MCGRWGDEDRRPLQYQEIDYRQTLPHRRRSEDHQLSHHEPRNHHVWVQYLLYSTFKPYLSNSFILRIYHICRIYGTILLFWYIICPLLIGQCRCAINGSVICNNVYMKEKCNIKDSQIGVSYNVPEKSTSSSCNPHFFISYYHHRRCLFPYHFDALERSERDLRLLHRWRNFRTLLLSARAKALVHYLFFYNGTMLLRCLFFIIMKERDYCTRRARSRPLANLNANSNITILLSILVSLLNFLFTLSISSQPRSRTRRWAVRLRASVSISEVKELMIAREGVRTSRFVSKSILAFNWVARAPAEWNSWDAIQFNFKLDDTRETSSKGHGRFLRSNRVLS